MKTGRRQFIQKMGLALLPFQRQGLDAHAAPQKKLQQVKGQIYRSVGGSPSANMQKAMELAGGIHACIQKNDIVLIKPNLQWWNQGATNLETVETLVDLIFSMDGGFSGEVAIVENVHRGRLPYQHNTGWTTPFVRNGGSTSAIQTMTDVLAALQKKYGNQVSAVHWMDVWNGAKKISGPEEGTGYVYCDGKDGNPLIELANGDAEEPRTTLMTYPVFQTDRGTLIDFKKGVYENGRYTEQPVRFINFAALNYHGRYTGMTSAVKNYFGVTDLSGGSDPYKNGKMTDSHYNFHAFAYNGNGAGPVPGIMGAAVGKLMQSIRKADLNIVAAEWVGLASRVKPPVAHTRAVLMSSDPVALDYHSAKYILYPNSGIPIHNPDAVNRPLHQYLTACAPYIDGIVDESDVEILSWNHETACLQNRDELTVHGKIEWGRDVKHWMKYLALRYDLI